MGGRHVNEAMNRENNASSRSLRETIQFYLIDSETLPGKIIDIAIIFLNILVVAVFIIQTYEIPLAFAAVLKVMETVIVGFFIVEYITRLYGARNRIGHLFSPYSIIDLLSILPTILEPLMGTEQIGVLILLRMFRVFRILRFLRFFQTADFFFGKISDAMLNVLRLVMTIFMIFFVASGLFFIVEGGVENPMISNFGDAFYFAVVALTTVGFGDIVPVSGAGKAVTVLCILSGIVLIPWQIGKIVREWLYFSQKKPVICEHCGLKYHDHDAVHCKACGHLIYQEYEDRT